MENLKSVRETAKTTKTGMRVRVFNAAFVFFFSRKKNVKSNKRFLIQCVYIYTYGTVKVQKRYYKLNLKLSNC